MKTLVGRRLRHTCERHHQGDYCARDQDGGRPDHIRNEACQAHADWDQDRGPHPGECCDPAQLVLGRLACWVLLISVL